MLSELLYNGSSKAIEARGAMDIRKSIYTKSIYAMGKACVRYLVSDDDSTTRSVLVHTYEDLQCIDSNFSWPKEPKTFLNVRIRTRGGLRLLLKNHIKNATPWPSG